MNHASTRRDPIIGKCKVQSLTRVQYSSILRMRRMGVSWLDIIEALELHCRPETLIEMIGEPRL